MPDRTVPRERPHVRGCGAVTQVSSYWLVGRPNPLTGRSATATSPSLWAERGEESHRPRLPTPPRPAGPRPPARPAHSAHAHRLHTHPPGPRWCSPRHSCSGRPSGRRAHAFGFRCVLIDGQQHGEGGAQPGFTLDFDAAAMPRDDSKAHRQTQPGALSLGLGGEEGIEDALQVLLRDADPGVLNRNGHRAPGLTQNDAYGAAVANRLDGVTDQVD